MPPQQDPRQDPESLQDLHAEVQPHPMNQTEMKSRDSDCGPSPYRQLETTASPYSSSRRDKSVRRVQSFHTCIYLSDREHLQEVASLLSPQAQRLGLRCAQNHPAEPCVRVRHLRTHELQFLPNQELEIYCSPLLRAFCTA